MNDGTRVGVINVTGYAGAELARILGRHPHVKLVAAWALSCGHQPKRPWESRFWHNQNPCPS